MHPHWRKDNLELVDVLGVRGGYACNFIIFSLEFFSFNCIYIL